MSTDTAHRTKNAEVPSRHGRLHRRPQLDGSLPSDRSLTGKNNLPTAILDQAKVAMVAVDLAGRVTHLNDAAQDLYGTTAEAAIGLPVREVVALPGDHLSVDEIVASVVASGEWVGETWARNARGTRIRVLLTVSPLKIDDVVVGMIGIALDNSARHDAGLNQSHLAVAIDQTAESVMIADSRANIVYVNPAFERVSGYSREEVIGKNPRILQSGTQSPAYYRRMWKALAAGKTWSGELVNRRKDGTLYREEAAITPVFDADGDLASYVAVKRDVTRLREIEASLDEAEQDRLAVVQALAHLAASGSLVETAHDIAGALTTLSGIDRGAVFAFDDAGGATMIGYSGSTAHPRAEGDRLPLATARRFLERARVGAWVEMAQGATNANDDWAPLEASGLRAAAYVPFGTDQVLGLIAIGTEQDLVAARITSHLSLAVEFAATATLLLGDGLRARRVSSVARAGIESIIETASFHPVFQPVVDIGDGHPIGFEALTRFHDGTPPDQVFESAVSVGLGLDLEATTLKASLLAAQALPEGTWLSLNVSPDMVLEHDRLMDLLSIRSRPIVLEITEHRVITDYEALRTAYISLGPDIRLAVDDAGSGVANFGHIIELRPDFVKVDVSLVRGINTDLTRQALIVGLRHFARATNCLVIAEGVETEAERQTLRALDLHFAQGYLFGRPEEATAWSGPKRNPQKSAPHK